MGNSDSLLTPEKIEELKEKTSFTTDEIKRVIRRYAQYDTSEGGVEGIRIDDLAMMPEFSTIPWALRAIEMFAVGQRVHAEQFLLLFAKLSSQTPIDEKRQFLFSMFDIYRDKSLKHEELVRMYKSIFTPSLSDEEIINVVCKILKRNDLKIPREIDYEDFSQLVSSWEIREKFTVQLQLNT